MRFARVRILARLKNQDWNMAVILVTANEYETRQKLSSVSRPLCPIHLLLILD